MLKTTFVIKKEPWELTYGSTQAQEGPVRKKWVCKEVGDVPWEANRLHAVKMSPSKTTCVFYGKYKFPSNGCVATVSGRESTGNETSFLLAVSKLQKGMRKGTTQNKAETLFLWGVCKRRAGDFFVTGFARDFCYESMTEINEPLLLYTHACKRYV